MRKIVPALGLSAALVSGALLTFPTWAGQSPSSPAPASAESPPRDAAAAAAAGWEKIESFDNIEECLDAGTKGQEEDDWKLWFCFPGEEEGAGDESTTAPPTMITTDTTTTTSETPDEGDEGHGFDLWALKDEGTGESGTP